jgi:hypothetical protein
MSGELVTVDKLWLGELAEHYAEAIGAVERDNRHFVAIKLERRCTSIRFETGTAPADCPK